MLFDVDGQFYSGTTAWTITGNEWSPNLVDLTVSYPTLQNTGELVWWIQVYSATASNSDTFEFRLACSATNDATNLNGTIVYPVHTEAWTSGGAFMQKSDGMGGFWSVEVPANMKLRYWQVYCAYGSVTSGASVVVYTGLALRSAIPVRAGTIVTASSVTLP